MKKWHYYNENDEKACAWIRELIAARLVPDGEVDQRSICDVQPGDITGFVQCHFFAGILGWPLALKLAGWPEDREVWTGSCPYQPFSDAGKGLGEADPRHLWPYFRNLIGYCRPAVVFGEQVGSKAGRLWLSRVRSDFQGAAYAFGAADLAAASLGAPHKRQRLFWVADSQCDERRTNQPRREPERRTADGRDCSQPSGLADTQSRGFGANGDAPGQTGHTEQREQAGRLADTDGGKPQDGQLQRSGGQLQLAQNPPADARLGNAILPGLEGYAGNGTDGSQPGRLTPGLTPGQAGSATETGASSGLADSPAATQLSMFGSGMGNSPGSGSAGQNWSSEQEQGPGTRSIHAFWRDTRWIPTTDPRTGKTVMRRIPLEPGFQSMVERLSGSVASMWPEGLIKLQKKVIAYASHIHKNHAEALRSLWQAVCAQDKNRIANGVCSQAILLSALLELARQMGQSAENSLQQGFSEAPEELLRSLRDSPEESQAVARSSPGFGLDQQRFPQLADLVHELSHEAAQCAKAVALYTSMTLFPLSQRLPGRVGILRGAGNSIVPWVAKEFIEAFLEAEKDHVAPFGQSQKPA